VTSDEPASFAAYVTARGDSLHDTAYLMTGDHAAAEQLLLDALVAAWPRWHRGSGDPEPFVQRALRDGVAPRWHRGSSREPATELAVDDEPLRGPDPAAPGDVDAAQRAADRFAAVVRRVSERRRLRRRVGAVAAVVVAVCATAVVVKTLEPQAHPAASAHAPHRVAPTPPHAALPTYYDGGRMLQSVKVDLSHVASTTLAFTPTVWGLDFAFRCPVLMSGEARFEIRLKGHLILGTGCSGPDPDGVINVPGEVSVDGSSGDYGSSNPSARTYWQALGIRIGQPARVVITVKEPGFATSPPPALLVGVYQDVPFAEYPLPARPATVPPPEETGLPATHAHRITLPGGSANGTWTLRLPYRPDLVVQGGVSGPGQIQVKVDGVLVSGYDSYDYQRGRWFTANVGPPWPPWPPGRKQPRAGQTITVTVTMSGFEGPDWRLELGRSAT
jgi:hypothetical protein